MTAPDQAYGAALTGVARTALQVAAVRADETSRSDRLFDDPLAGRFVTADGRCDGRDDPAGAAFVVARTYALDRFLLDAFRSGITQVVMLGAGLDTRAFRLDWPLDARCFEVDSTDVQAFKRDVLAQWPAGPRCTRVEVVADLRADWFARLLLAGHVPDRPTAWLIEGVLAFLDVVSVDRLMTEVDRVSAPASRLGLTAGGRRAGRTAGWWLPEDTSSWLSRYGWSGHGLHVPDLLRSLGRPADETAAIAEIILAVR